LPIQAIDGSTHQFLVGTHADIEMILSQNPDDLLRLDEAPPKPDNTLQLDSIHFDVPIMKLDEWMEESWSEDLADDLLLKPSQFEIDLPADEHAKTNRSKRSNRTRSRRKPATVDPPSVPSGEDLEVNVVFRKRV
jgi:hypothetical protein